MVVGKRGLVGACGWWRGVGFDDGCLEGVSGFFGGEMVGLLGSKGGLFSSNGRELLWSRD